MDKEIKLEYDAFIRSFKRNKDIAHSFLLGAGASISSGIQSATDCIWEWKKDIYLSKNPNASDYYKNYKNESVKKSIQFWLNNESIYPQIDSKGEYFFYAEKAYPIADDRRKYFQELSENKEPYIGYKLLCLLCSKDIVKAVWTTNFDGLFERAAFQSTLTPISITLDCVDRIYRNLSKKEVLSINLHGDYKYGSLKNTETELDTQNEVFIETLKRYHNDKNLIVIGYSGRDKSLMKALKETFSIKGSGRLYWCGYGHEIDNDVSELINIARDNGREAFFIPTDGFDKTLLHLTKACFEDDSIIQENISALLKTSGVDEIETTDFSLDVIKTDKYIKSNLHPISFPKEVYQFEINYGDNRPWSFLRKITSDKNICAVPYKQKVYALADMTAIKQAFGSILKSEILRVPISTKDINYVSAFKNLMLQAVIKFLSLNPKIKTNNRDKIWQISNNRMIKKANLNITEHKAIYLSLFFDKQDKYGFLAVKPTIHFESDKNIPRKILKELSKQSLEKLRNKQFAEYLDEWNTLLFNNTNLKFDYPPKMGTGFDFTISSNTSFAEIMVSDKNFKTYHPKSYNKKYTLHKGIQFLEPQLLFRNNITQNISKDFHPMRALKNHKPWDFPLNGNIFSNDIQLGVLCGNKYSQIFAKFLNELNQIHKVKHNPDYLIDYPGFSNAYNIPLSIPLTDDKDKWLDIEFDTTNANIKSQSLKLARLITSKIDQVTNTQSNLVIFVFIPSKWESFCKYEIEGERFDLHNYIKAFAASKGISTQLIREKTLNDQLKCQIFWWLSLSLYVKSLRTPWILNNSDEETAYAGIGYSINKKEKNTEIVIGCSHIYNSKGEGLKYKLSKVDDFYLDKQSNPYLSYDDAFQFGVSIRELFYRSMNKLPKRVVIHKRTRFTKDEVNGIVDSLKLAKINSIDLIEINYESDARFMATSIYKGEMKIDGFPLSRGTCIVTNRTSALLWTHGIVPSVKNPRYKYYLGGRSIPAPLKIIKHYGDSNISLIANEILGLTKMNWNSFDLYTKLPATINSSNQIAKIGKLLSRFEGKTYDYRLFI